MVLHNAFCQFVLHKCLEIQVLIQSTADIRLLTRTIEDLEIRLASEVTWMADALMDFVSSVSGVSPSSVIWVLLVMVAANAPFRNRFPSFIES